MREAIARSGTLGIVLLAGVLPCVAGAAANLAFGPGAHLNEPMHEFLEVAGSCIAFGVSLLLLFQARHEEGLEHVVWAASALLAMGLLDALHGVVAFGLAWSWLRHGATLAGGALFALVWIRPPAVARRRMGWFVSCVGALALAGGVFIWARPHGLPPAFHGNDYLPLAKVANALGGLGFWAATVFFLGRHARNRRTQDLVFACHTLLFGTAGVMFGFSHLWGADWWVWHVFRFVAYGIILAAAYEVVAGLYADIGRRKTELEERVRERTVELRESEERLRFALETCRTGAWDLDLEHHAAVRSLEHDRIFGYGEALPAWTYEMFLEHVLPEDRSEVDAKFRRAMATRGDWTFECRIRRVDGEVRWIWAAGRQRTGGGKAGRMAGIVQDITERKRTEEAQAAARKEAELAQRHLEAVLEAIPLAVVLVDAATGKFSYLNRRAMELYGIDYVGFDLDAHVAKVHALRPDGTPFPVEEMPVSRSLRFGEAVRNVEMIIERSDRTRFPVLVSSAPLHDAGGKVSAAVAVFDDITESKRAEEALKASDERFDLAVRSAGVGIWDYDVGSGRVYFSPRWKSIFGYAEQEIGDSVEDWARLLHPEEKERIVQLQEDFLAGRESTITAEYRLRHKDGSYRWIQAQGLVVRDASGKARRFIGSHADITERRRAEEALRESESRAKVAQAVELERQRLYTVLETLPAMVCLLTPDYRVAFANRSFRQRFGEVEGRRCYEQCFGRSEPCEFCESYNVLKTGQPQQWEVKGPDGSVISAYDYPFTDVDGSPMILEMDIDITEFRRTQAALREAGAYNRSLIEASLDPLVTIGRDGRITDVNQATEAATGCRRAELVGTDFSNYFTEPDKARAGYEQVFREGFVRDYPLELRRRDGSVMSVLYHASVYRDENGQVIGVFAAARDITARKRAEAALKAANERLEERTARLQEVVGELEHFSYTITHDMRAPLRAMRGFGELVRDLCSACEHQERVEFIGRILTSAGRMDRLITDALDYSLSVRQELPLEDVDLGLLLRGMLDTYPEFQTTKAKIEVEGSLPVVLGNVAGLTQCFSNLLGNGVKFVKPGQKPEIRIWAEVLPGGSPSRGRPEWVRVWVEDKGIGISREMVPRVFDMFSRGDNKYEGTGIGLALVRKVAQRMGGRVGVESELGNGSRFWLDLRSGQRQ